jgi:outer membrane protein assembly factor BamB/subtilisin family serine protease
MRFSAIVLLCVTSVFCGAATHPDSEPAPITAKELAQGFRDHVILARPRAARRAAADREESGEGVRVRQKFARFGDLRVIDLAEGEDAASAVARLKATGRYEFVEPDYIRQIALTPNDPAYVDGSMWQYNNTGLSNGVVGADIKAIDAWDIIHDAPNVIVAVVDTGINLNHQDIAANLWTNPSPTFGDVHGARFSNGLTTGVPSDDNGHGTHVAGTIGAIGGNGLATAGIAWRVQIMPIKVLGSSGTGSVSDIARGIDYAVAHGAHIINASYGISGSGGFSDTERAAIAAVRAAGIIFVAAAGNDAANLDVTRFYPASHAFDNLVTVGNSTRRDELAVSSNYGGAVDLFAPGSEIVSLDYQVSTGTRLLSGTSMSAPHVSGALALLKARFPGDNYRQLINRLLRGVDRGERFIGKAQTGGRLNLLKALNTTTNRPFNDDFADRPRLNTDNLALRGSNAGATAESGEPAHASVAPGASIWWEWVAPTSGTVSIDTIGSDYDTVLAVYTGGSLGTLASVAANDDSGATTSRVSFSAQAGTAYEIAVGGKLGQSGLTLLNLGTTPANDTFAAATVLTGPSAHLNGTNAHCSRETDEPYLLGYPGGLSLWYRWTAPKSGRFQVAATSTDFDPLLGVFTGSTVSALSLVAQSDNTGATGSQTGSLCTFEAVAGTTYSFVVESKSAISGQFTLNIVDSVWQGVTADTVPGSAAIATDGTVYFGSGDRSIYAFSADGTQKWTYPTGGLIDTCAPAIGNDGTVYIGSNDGKFYALTATGSLRWSRDFGPTSPMSNSPAIAADGTVYVKADDGWLYALTPNEGGIKWKINVGSTLSYGSPTIAADGTVYQGSENGTLYAVNPDGTLKWSYATGSNSDIYTAVALDNAGNLYFSVLNTGRLFSLTPAGALRWTYSGASVGSSSSAAVSADGGTVYFGGYDSKLHAVNTSNGTARWVYSLGAEVRASSPAIDANGVVYIGCYDFKLYAINPNGTLKRTYDTGNVVRSSPVIAGTRLYVGSNDHKLYVFDLGVGVGSGPWPQYHQNARRTGRAVTATVITSQPTSQTVLAGSNAQFTIAVTGDSASTYQWQRNGTNIAGATGATLSLTNVQPAHAGIYAAVVSNSGVTVTSQPVVLGVLSTTKVLGAAAEVGPNIVHPNGNVYDQVLLQGASAAVTADPGQIVRTSFIDLTDDIVQVEFSGAGTLSLSLDSSTGPAAPVNYNQNVNYMRGHATIVIAGADETTHLTIFSVGTITAINQSLFRSGVTYDAVADLATVAILSANGKFGSFHTGNASYLAARSITGIYAPDVQFTDSVILGDVNASDTATPCLLFGSTPEVQIAGGDLWQANSRAVQVSGIPKLRFVTGTKSNDARLPAQNNQARLEQKAPTSPRRSSSIPRREAPRPRCSCGRLRVFLCHEEDPNKAHQRLWLQNRHASSWRWSKSSRGLRPPISCLNSSADRLVADRGESHALTRAGCAAPRSFSISRRPRVRLWCVRHADAARRRHRQRLALRELDRPIIFAVLRLDHLHVFRGADQVVVVRLSLAVFEVELIRRRRELPQVVQDRRLRFRRQLSRA